MRYKRRNHLFSPKSLSSSQVLHIFHRYLYSMVINKPEAVQVIPDSRTPAFECRGLITTKTSHKLCIFCKEKSLITTKTSHNDTVYEHICVTAPALLSKLLTFHQSIIHNYRIMKCNTRQSALSTSDLIKSLQLLLYVHCIIISPPNGETGKDYRFAL